MDKEQFLVSVKNGKLKNGKNLLIAHLEGKTLSPLQAIRAWCYECMGFYDDGARDCESQTCPLHPYMPYNPNKRKAKTGNPEALAKARAAKMEQAAEDLDALNEEPDAENEDVA